MPVFEPGDSGQFLPATRFKLVSGTVEQTTGIEARSRLCGWWGEWKKSHPTPPLLVRLKQQAPR